jgi:hypothetical protein
VVCQFLSDRLHLSECHTEACQHAAHVVEKKFLKRTTLEGDVPFECFHVSSPKSSRNVKVYVVVFSRL